MSVLLLSGCATLGASNETVGYEAAVVGEYSSRSQPAQVIHGTEKILLDKGYFKLGRVSVVQVIETDGAEITHADTPINRAASEAAARGADVLLLDKDADRQTATRTKTGACLRRRQETQTVLVPTYSWECRNVGNNRECSNRQTGTRYEPQVVTVCDEYQRIPYLHVTLLSDGSIWRYDPQRAAADRALQKALTGGPASELEKLLVQHPTVEAPLLDGRRPLAVAIAAGNTAAVRLLLERGAKPEPADLQLATEKGRSAVARLLIEHGPADGDDKISQQSALWSASVLGQTLVVEALLARGADYKVCDDADGQNALHKAAWACQLDTVKLLIARGADPKAVTKDGERAVDLARSSAIWSRRTPAEQAACRAIVKLLDR